MTAQRRTKKKKAPSRRQEDKQTASARADKASKKAPRRRRARDKETDAEPVSQAEPTTLRPEDLELGIGSRVVPPTVHWEEDPQPSSTPTVAAAIRDVQNQIRELEARLDGMINKSRENGEAGPGISAQVGSAARGFVDKLTSPLPDDGVSDALRELLSSDYYLRQWGRVGMRNRSEEVDEFGLDPKYEARLTPLFDFLHQRYFRTDVSGIERVPAEGRCLIVANHSGTLPLDGAMLRTAFRLEHPTRRPLRWLAEDFVYYLPFLGAFMNRIGAVRACQENAERLLKRGHALAVFPEGVKGIGKLYRDRYQLQRFGRGGFIRLCLRTQTPLVPCAIIGAEEANPMLFRVERLSRALGLPYVPVTPTFPLLGPMGLLPAPTKWRIRFGEVMRFDGYGREAADDHVLVGRLADRVRTGIQSMLDDEVGRRQSVWFG